LDNTPSQAQAQQPQIGESLESKLDTIKGIFSNEPVKKQVSASEEVENQRINFENVENY